MRAVAACVGSVSRASRYDRSRPRLRANELARREGRYAFVSVCAAGGMAGALLLSRA